MAPSETNSRSLPRRSMPCHPDCEGRGEFPLLTQFLSFKDGLHVKQLLTPHCNGLPPVFWWVVLDLRHERLWVAGTGTLHWEPQHCWRLLLHKAQGWALTFGHGEVRDFTLCFSPPCSLEGYHCSGLAAENVWRFLGGDGAWPSVALQEARLALTGAPAVEEDTSPYPVHAIPVAFSWKKVAADSRGCVPPKAPAAQAAVGCGGVLSLPRTDNLRALPMVKFLRTISARMGEPFHLLFTLPRTAVEFGLSSG